MATMDKEQSFARRGVQGKQGKQKGGLSGTYCGILDEHPLWLDAVEAVLARLHVKVEGKTTSVARMLELVDSQRPDVLLLEPSESFGDSRRLDLIRRAREIYPAIKVTALSNAHEASAVDAAFAAGAVAYVFKSAHPEDLPSAIRRHRRVSLLRTLSDSQRERDVEPTAGGPGTARAHEA